MGNERTGRILLAFLGELTAEAIRCGEAFLMSAGSAKQLARNMRMIDRQYYSSMQSLRRHGYVKRVNPDQFLITPKGVKRAKRLAAEQPNRIKKGETNNWGLVVFDIPTDKNQERAILRSILKRKGFVGIQRSVYIAPSANFEELSSLREELGIAEFVTFLEVKVASTEDDRALRRKFGIK